MFDIGFWELALIGLVALLVVGPERLPTVARTAGLWIGKLRQFIGSVKADIDKELKADELRRILDQQAKSNPLEQILDDETRDSLNQIRKQTESEVSDVKRSGDAFEQEIKAPDDKR